MGMSMNMIMPEVLPGMGAQPSGLDTGPSRTASLVSEKFAGLLTGRIKELESGQTDQQGLVALVPAVWQPFETPTASDQTNRTRLQSGFGSGFPAGTVLAPANAQTQDPAGLSDALAKFTATVQTGKATPPGLRTKQVSPTLPPATFGNEQLRAQAAGKPGVAMPELADPGSVIQVDPLAHHARKEGASTTDMAGRQTPLSEHRFERLLKAERRADTGQKIQTDASARKFPEGSPQKVAAKLDAPLRDRDLPPLRSQTHDDAADPTPLSLPGGLNRPEAQVIRPALAPQAQPQPTHQQVPVRDHVVIEQVTSHFDRHGVFESGQAHLKLYPEELGEIRLDIDLNKGQLAARLQAETPEVRDILHRNLDHLKQALEHQGLKVNRLEVAVVSDSARSDGQAFHNGSGGHQGFAWDQSGSLFQHQGREQQQSDTGRFASHLSDPAGNEPTEDPPGTTEPLISASGVSLRA
ncbi:MAG: flagellar hook-length control protein FliK [Deltaproteobacteria bacterium]|nr:MAG: flagellar hook-length control protein FliK [Deltaproteobacteria bacterium]